MTPNIIKAVIRQFSTEIKEPLKSGQSIIFLGRATVDSFKAVDNQDGTHNYFYYLKTELVDIKDADQLSLVDDKRVKEKSRSQAIRQLAFRVAQETGLSEEGLYQSAQDEAEKYLQSKLDEDRDENL